MNDSSREGGFTDREAQGDAAGGGDLSELRKLLIGPERSELDELRTLVERSAATAQNISEVLPDAIAIRSLKDGRLSSALAPTIEKAITTSIQRDPHHIVDAISPVMGPSIRKAIADTIRRMLQSFNQTLEHSLSWNGLKWRIEAWRTGKSYGEIVLLHSLVFRVEQVFLIHRETGLLLQHVVAEAVEMQDADMVSGMLTAIQDFVHDSFRVGQGETLERMQVGEHSVWIEQGPKAVLAVVIQGQPPENLCDLLRDTIEAIHVQRLRELAEFTGDDTVFETVRPLLQDCLQVQYKPRARAFSPLFWVATAIVLMGLGVLCFWLTRAAMRTTRYIERVRNQPGIVLTNVERSRGGVVLNGLRDPMAVDPVSFAADMGLRPDRIETHWQPYHALYPDFILRRAVAALEPPPSLHLRLNDGVLEATGKAPVAWLRRTTQTAPLIPGISAVDLSDTTDTEFDRMVELRKEIERSDFIFKVGQAEFNPGQEDRLAALAASMQELLALACSTERVVTIQVIGHTDASGSETTNQRLSLERAQLTVATLSAMGVDTTYMMVEGRSFHEPAVPVTETGAQERNRRVSFHVAMEEVAKE
ncbi:OmpA family protein [bacterium]|nr:OmpA family protein [candidate division CSSED10-310 bacterium]